ncbi:MAG: general secretion pathway protein GspB [Gammaproteobacteria bacterium]|nr:general secretion pathway protein GspB [Gammaproteobacteria bacterium]
MSYILDALKKSEQERDRERKAIPSITSVHSAVVTEDEQTSATVLWLYVIAALLLLSTAALAYFYLFYPPNSTVSTVDGVPEEAMQIVEEATSTESIPQAVAVIPAPTPDAAVKLSARKQEQVPVLDQKKPTQKVIFSKEYLQLEDAVSAVDEITNENHEALPISELPEAIRQKIPSISFAGHVYSSIKKRRSVMINDRKMREGESVNAELTLVAITPNGAEFKFEGYTFMLDALQDWSY